MQSQQILIQYALAARKHAYAPYSKFQVGAALQCTDGSIFTGCNVENSSYSMTICAERAAIVQAIANEHRSFCAIAIVGGITEAHAKQQPCYPCGACLQVLSEFCTPDFPILLTDGSHSLLSCLPKQFHLASSDTESTTST